MKRAVSTLLVVTMLATSVSAFADPPATISPLTKGQPAPYSGVLLSPQAVAQSISAQDMVAKSLALSVQHQADIDAAQLQFQVSTLTTTCTADKTDLQAQVDDEKKQVNILTNQLKKTTGGPGVPFWIGTGAVGGIILSVLTAFAISKATK